MAKLPENASGLDARIRRKSSGQSFQGTVLHDSREDIGPVDDTPGEGVTLGWKDNAGGVWKLFIPAADIDESPGGAETTALAAGTLGYDFIKNQPAP